MESSDPSDIKRDNSRSVSELGPLFESLYKELRSLAGALYLQEKDGSILQPTALINEVWLKLAHSVESVNDRPHFFALAAKAMRQVISDHTRARRTEKRGGGSFRLTFSESSFGDRDSTIDLIEFHDSLEKLNSINPRQAEVAELRLLGSLSTQEIAGMLGVNERTVKRDWRVARIWLIDELGVP